ncbi:putative UDP-rhamnose:rhamnosyltransferase 1 isoform X2 [Telopea speciosissima]|uniref:putative UDP-rhamnose:rhamnosyltransferase 1 isoform X2 n=1 Tax=Telopea speciosissima TaxID=54955 RepID=UPI001CC3E383|nr:putative UDP-rhamnose:rhamnosyltransferase 1 isoform X2 [Telopea speciosissima]
MLPYLAFGHMIPFLHLSTALANSGIRVSYIISPENTKKLPSIPPHLSPLIQMVQLPLPHVDGLPDGAEANVDISMDQIPYLKIAYDLWKQPIMHFIEHNTPDWIIHDFAPYWISDIAREFNIPHILFSIFPASVYSFFGPPEYLAEPSKYWTSPERLSSPPEWITFPSTVAFPSYEAPYVLAGFFGTNASGVSDSKRIATCISSCKAVAIRSCKEYEGQHLDLLETLFRKTIIPVGLLPPAVPERRKSGGGGAGGEEEWEATFKWLDERKPNSVVFVGFGSESKLGKEEVYEIAHGLELSGLHFLWILRKPMWAVDDNDALPLGFKTRTESKGKVCMGWAPQVEILSHQSIGGTLFHSGWSSIVETLQFGHTLVVLPLVIDQSLNAALLVEKVVAVAVERDSKNGSFKRESIARALKKAMVDVEGERVRVRAREMKKIFGDIDLNQDYIDGFVRYLKKG